MFVLNRKRVYLIFTCLVLSIMVFQLKSSNNITTLETVALPVNKKIIVLDAGHGRRRWAEQQLMIIFQKLILI